MKIKIKYGILLCTMLILFITIPSIFTNAKYFSTITLQKDVNIGFMIFNIKQSDGETEIYEIEKGKQKEAKYTISNKNDDDIVNDMELTYYIKILDENNSEEIPVDVVLNDYEYITYFEDEEGNKYTKEELLEQDEEIQQNATEIKKGYGPIIMESDGKTKSTEDLIFTINVPNNYSNAEILNLKIKLIAEGTENVEFTAEETADLKIRILNSNLQNNNTNSNNNNSTITNTETVTNNTIENNIINSNTVETTNSIITNNELLNNSIITNNIIDNTINNEKNVITNSTEG